MGGFDFDVNKFASDYKTPATVIAVGTLGYFYLKLLLYFIAACIVLSLISSCTYCFMTGTLKITDKQQTQSIAGEETEELQYKQKAIKKPRKGKKPKINLISSETETTPATTTPATTTPATPIK